MNTMIASGGYPWTVIPVTDRNAYVNALEKASVGEDIAPFADFLAGLVKKRLAGEPLPPVFALRSRLSVQLNSSCRLRPDVISATPDHEPD
jgi:hypothetical protein